MYLAVAGVPNQLPGPELGLKKSGLFLNRSCCHFLTAHTKEVKLGSLDSLGHYNSNEVTLTSVVCLVQILQHLFKIASSGK